MIEGQTFENFEQVATEDHFEQGLKGSIRSMIAGQTFENFKTCINGQLILPGYWKKQKLKIELWIWGKRKLDLNRGGFRGMNPKQFRPGKPQEKGKQPMTWQPKPLCRFCGKRHHGSCTFETLRCFGCGEMGHKMSNCLKATRNQRKTLPRTDQQKPITPAPRGRPPAVWST